MAFKKAKLVTRRFWQDSKTQRQLHSETWTQSAFTVWPGLQKIEHRLCPPSYGRQGKRNAHSEKKQACQAAETI